MNAAAIQQSPVPPRRCLPTLLWLFIAGWLAGCHADSPAQSAGPRNALATGVAIDPLVIQTAAMDFADTYTNTMVDAYDAIQRQSSIPSVRRAALELKLNTARGAYVNAVNPNPIAAMADMVVLVNLQYQASQAPWYQLALGAAADKPRATLKQQDELVWTLAARYFSPAQIEELRSAIATWCQTHPDIGYVAMIRLIDLPQPKPKSGRSLLRTPESIFSLAFLDPLAGLDPAVREIAVTRATAARMFFYIQRMPDLVRWQGEMLYMDMLAAPELQTVVRNTTTFSDNTTRFTDACQQFADTISRFPYELTLERQRAIEQLDAALAVQRTAAIDQLAQATAHERDAAINQVAIATARERDATLTQLHEVVAQTITEASTAISQQRDAALKQASLTLDTQRQTLLAGAEQTTGRLGDRLMWQIIFASGGSALAIAAVMLGYRWARCRIGQGTPRGKQPL